MAKICDLCKTENSDENVFCEKCGNPLTSKSDEKPVEDEAIPKGVGKSKEAKKTDPKLFIIPLALIFVLIVGFMISNAIKSSNRKKAAKKVVIKYLTAIKIKNYSSALEVARGTGISRNWVDAFKGFIKQLTPVPQINKELYKSIVDLAFINSKIRRYFYINRSFPSSLNELTPVIMKEIPSVPGGGEYGYKFDSGSDNYTVFVKGDKFAKMGIPSNYPAFSKLDRLQVPGKKKIFSKWELVNFNISDVKDMGDYVQVSVTETSKFGPKTLVRKDEYELVKKGKKWIIKSRVSEVDPFTFAFAFTQMGGLAGKIGKSKGEHVDISLGKILMAFSELIDNPKALDSRRRYQLNKFNGILERVGQALSRYSRDNEGRYPKSLNWLVPKYLTEIPENPVSLTQDYVNCYEVSDDLKEYTIYSPGNLYKSSGLEENFPQYTSRYRRITSSSQIKVEPIVLPDEKVDDKKVDDKKVDDKKVDDKKTDDKKTDDKKTDDKKVDDKKVDDKKKALKDDDAKEVKRAASKSK